jgi:hypothetical protein
VTLRTKDIQHDKTEHKHSVIMMSFAFSYCYAKFHCAECRYADCRYAECRYADCRGAV